MFSVYHELKILKNNIEIDKLAVSSSSSNLKEIAEPFEEVFLPPVPVQPTESNTSLTKRPQSDKLKQIQNIDAASGDQVEPNVAKRPEIKAD